MTKMLEALQSKRRALAIFSKIEIGHELKIKGKNWGRSEDYNVGVSKGVVVYKNKWSFTVMDIQGFKETYTLSQLICEDIKIRRVANVDN